MKDIQNNIIEYVDNEENVEEHYQNILQHFEDQKIINNKQYLKTILHIISNISNYHHRYPGFNEKIEKILILNENAMKENYSNYELFKIFKNNKRILRFLINMNILNINENITKDMKKTKYEGFNYFIYLFPENTLKVKSTKEIDDQFENKLNEGENENYISKIIREDSIDEFIIYIEQYDYSINEYIKRSIFETNTFLINHPNTTLIEYSAFFGSNEIFEYLMNKGVKLTPSLWLYSIHGNNPKIINHLIQNKIRISSQLYHECIEESIKCHHNNIFNYLKSNIKTIVECENCEKINNYDNIYMNIRLSSIHYYNFSYFPKKMNNMNEKKKMNIFEYACRYDYPDIVKYLLKETNLNMKTDKISTTIIS